MAGLQREVVRWLQSLDLSYPLHNPRRDFANGFLIAEIFSRYYMHDLDVNLFYTGHSTEHKTKNWEQLAKFFKKHGIRIPSEAMDAVMQTADDAAVQFVQNIYTLLTGRRLQASEKVEEQLPHYRIPTATFLLRIAPPSAKPDLVVDAQHAYAQQRKLTNRLR
ncbi:hypothetical protein BJ742DRAFT_47775 [Cladochytrium replicatum]|nr:hypothetical protein BJ742DRAFT_47775 [Cladochytrium replicatum]